MNENSIINQPLLMGAIDKILIKRSITQRVSDTQKLKGPLGIITGSKWDKVLKKLKVINKEVESDTKKIRTEFTIESLQDLESTYGEDFYNVLSHYLVDDLVYQIDEDFSNLVNSEATAISNLTFDASFDKELLSVGQSIAIKVIKGLADLPISDNRSPNGWAIVSGNVAAILASTTTLTQDGNDDSPSYLGNLAGVDFYIDYTYDATQEGTDKVVFGIKGNGISKGSTIYSPYDTKWIETTSSESGEKIFFVLHRSTSTLNPMDKEYKDTTGNSGFLGKFNVDLSALQVIQ